MMGDIRIAADDARFALPEPKVGVSIDAGGDLRLIAEIGAGATRLLAFTGRRIDAETALRLGIVQEVVPKDALVEHVRALALEIAANAPLAVQAIKRTINYRAQQGLAEALRFEAASAAPLFTSDDMAQGYQAMAAKTPPEFERFVPQHTAQWGCQGKPGHFGAWPDALEFNRALVQAQCKLGRTRFIRILVDNQVISSQYAFAFGDSYFWELPARATGDQWERFSLGPTGIVTMIAAGITEGRKRIEGGLAHYDYKLRLNAREHATRTFRLISARARSRVASRVLNLWRLSFLLGYHKIWYRRVAPHLPRRFWGPQWKSWLKLDF
jgi:hypothetical protein